MNNLLDKLSEKTNNRIKPDVDENLNNQTLI